MKKYLYLILNCLIISANAQVPQGIPYQAVARNGQGQPLTSTNVKVRFSILDSTATGTAVYVESHSTTTSALGLFSANVGMGTATTGTFSSINWGQNYKFLKVELDTTATGNGYIDLGTQQMMSVPYALYAGNVYSVSESTNMDTSGNNHYTTVNASGIFVVPNGVYLLQIDVWGGGGGGGSNRYIYTGGGGGSGAFGRFLMNVKPNDTLNLEIGQGGLGYADNYSGTNCGCSSQGQNGGNTRIIRKGAITPSIVCGGGGGGGSPCTNGSTGPYGICALSNSGNAGGGAGGNLFQTGLGSGVVTLSTTQGNQGNGTVGAAAVCNSSGQCFGQGGNYQANGVQGGILFQW